MKISYNWLKTYADFDKTPEELAVILTNTGLEVEGHEDFETVKGALEGIVVGEVLECEKHPNADRLSITKVNAGIGRILPIVCGAPNVARGQKVAVALPGTTLYSNDGSFTIKKTRIRGEESEGMICAEDELGLGNDHSGIIILDDRYVPGQALSEIYTVSKDTVFEIGLTPNRIDGASHLGTARDLVAFLNIDDQKITLQKPDISSFKPDNQSLSVSVKIVNQEACIRYSGLTLTDIEVKESPDWLKNRLLSIGLKPINNIVDITNFVLHETGQPLHAFDAEKINKQQVIVQTLPEGTSFITLDEQERKLTANDLMICNATEAMCIGGVFGGLNSGVSTNTHSIFLESACFNPVWIRRTSRHHGINTDSSFRFERGTDPNGTIYALKRAALLMKEIAGAKVSSEIVDYYPHPINPWPVQLSWKNLNRLVGIQIPQETVRQILGLLDIAIVSETPESLSLEVATYRTDVKREADVIEEILRIYGYNNIGISDVVHSTLSYAPNPDPELIENRIAEQLVGQGFNELMSNSLTKSTYYSDLLNVSGKKTVELVNPLSNDLKAMRATLLFGALESVRLNISFRRTSMKGFEFGNTYSLLNAGKPFLTESFDEVRRLGLVLTGFEKTETWHHKRREVTFFQMKSVVFSILERLGIDESLLQGKEPDASIYDEGISFSLNDKELVSFGKVHHRILEYFEIEQPVFFAEFNWDRLLGFFNPEVKFRELPRFPEVKRDLALILDKSTPFEEIRQLAFQVDKKLIRSVNLFDVFESEKIGKDKKSYAVSFILQDENKTLTDKDIDKTMKNLIAAFKNKLGADLR